MVANKQVNVNLGTKDSWRTLEAFANLKNSEGDWRSFLQKDLKFLSQPETGGLGKSAVERLSEFRWYQDLLRSVWAMNDPDGHSLAILFRVEEPEQVLDLPKGKPFVEGITGQIRWKFSTKFQQSLYELMQVRWRAKICRECGKYFIAKNTAQTFCSEKCAHAAQLKRSMEYWNREGKAKRETKGRERRND